MEWPSDSEDGWIRVLACDPGTVTLGLFLLEYSVEDNTKFRAVWAGTLHVKNKTHPDSLALLDSERDVRLQELEDLMVDAINIIRPKYFATETPFMRRGKMSAYESGIELQAMIRRAVRRCSMTMAINGYNPIIVKHNVGVDHIKTTKEDVQTAVKGVYKDTAIDIDALDEHSADAGAVAYIYYRKEVLDLPPLFIREKKAKGTRPPRRRRRRGRKKKD